MKTTAYYYEIVDPNLTIVDFGILRHSEDMIYPGQSTNISELPSECEAHHFNVPGYTLIGFYFEIDTELIYKLQI